MNLLNAPREDSDDNAVVVDLELVKQYIWSMRDSLIVFGIAFVVGISVGFVIYSWVNSNTRASNFFLVVYGITTIFLIYQALKSFRLNRAITKEIARRQNESLTSKE